MLLMSKSSSVLSSTLLMRPGKHNLNATSSGRASKAALVMGVSSSVLYGNSMIYYLRSRSSSPFLSFFGTLVVFGSAQSTHSEKTLRIYLKTYRWSSSNFRLFLTQSKRGSISLRLEEYLLVLSHLEWSIISIVTSSPTPYKLSCL